MMADSEYEQPSIFDLIHDGESATILSPIVKPEKDGSSETSSLERQFLRFDELNPHVNDMIVKIAFELKRRGFKRAGMKMIFERLRWLWAMQTQGEDYKLNNNYTAFYARKVMREHQELEGFFKTRVQRHQE